MNIIKSILGIIKPMPKTEREKFVEKINNMEKEKIMIMLRLGRQRDKQDPNILKIEEYEEEIKQLDLKIENEKKKYGYLPQPILDLDGFRENIKKTEKLKDKAIIKLEKEKGNLNPNSEKVKIYEREVKQWVALLEKAKDALEKGEI